jgi:hypothetical protein
VAGEKITVNTTIHGKQKRKSSGHVAYGKKWDE